jgi:NADH-quinone oxidoreductase subunit B
MFNNYAIVQGVDQVVPVDVYVPGCPPGPETLLHGIIMLHEQIRTGELLKRREASPTGGAGIEVVQRDGVRADPISLRAAPERPAPDPGTVGVPSA